MLFKGAVLCALIIKVLCEDDIFLYNTTKIIDHSTFINNANKNKVTDLDVRGTCIDCVSQNAFTGFDNLKRLNMNNNKIKCLPDKLFNNLQKLYFLGLSYNEIKYFDKHTFSKLRNLKELRLNANLLFKLEVGLFNHNVALEEIDLNTNKLTYIPGLLFNKLRNLKILNLSSNRINYINKFALPRNLQKFRIFNNKLQHLNLDETVLNNLKEFFLHKNPYYCDCKLKEVFKLWKSKFQNNTNWKPACDNPKHLRHKIWTSLREQDFVCHHKEAKVVVVGRTGAVLDNGIVHLPTGQTAIVFCSVDVPASKVVITYNGKNLLEHLGKNMRKFYSQAEGEGKRTLLKIIIHDIKMKDSGTYKCLADGREEGINVVAVERDFDHYVHCCPIDCRKPNECHGHSLMKNYY